jgi:hypothetical protein
METSETLTPFDNSSWHNGKSLLMLKSVFIHIEISSKQDHVLTECFFYSQITDLCSKYNKQNNYPSL